MANFVCSGVKTAAISTLGRRDEFADVRSSKRTARRVGRQGSILRCVVGSEGILV